MALGNFSKVGRWALAAVAVVVLASVAMAAANVKVVGAKASANTVVVTLKNNGNTGATGAVTVFAVAADGRGMQSAATFAVAPNGQANTTLVFDAVVGSITGVDCGAISDDGLPF